MVKYLNWIIQLLCMYVLVSFQFLPKNRKFIETLCGQYINSKINKITLFVTEMIIIITNKWKKYIIHEKKCILSIFCNQNIFFCKNQSRYF